MTIGETIRSLRKKKGMTQAELAQAIGVSTYTIIRYESGVSYPNFRILQNIEEEFGIRFGYNTDPSTQISAALDDKHEISDNDNPDKESGQLLGFRMKLGTRLSKLMEERGFSATSLGKKTGVSQTVISAILRNDSNPSIATLEAICKGLDIPLACLFSKDSYDSLTDDEKRLIKLYRSTLPQGRLYSLASVEAFCNQYNVSQKLEEAVSPAAVSDVNRNPEKAVKPLQRLMIPVVGRSAAGLPIEMIEVPEDPVYINGETRIQPGDFAVIAAGDSMIGVGISDGNKCIIRPQNCVENGQIALVAVGDSSTIKRFFMDEDGFRLVPCNPDSPVQNYPPDASIRVLGRLISVVK